jgi:hypothetical protein
MNRLITQEDWDEYERRLKAFNEHMESIRPKEDDPEYSKKLAEWHMACSCDAPNKPGYYRANND